MVKYIFKSHQKNGGQNHNIKTASKFFLNVVKSCTECTVGMFKSRVFRKICLLGTKKGDIRGDWRKLYKDVLLAKYHEGDQIKEQGMVRPHGVHVIG
jgi:hypothetical protein